MSVLAYIDPGSGALAWQIIGAATVGCLFYVKKARDFFAKLGRKILGRD